MILSAGCVNIMYVNINYLLEGDGISAKTINLQHTQSVATKWKYVAQQIFVTISVFRDKDI